MKKDVEVSSRMWNDAAGNWYSSCTVISDWLPAVVEECWHLRKPYNCDGIWRVPVPATFNGKPSYSTSIYDAASVVSISARIGGSGIEVGADSAVPVIARHAELVVATRTWADTRGVACRKPYIVINFRGLPQVDVPPPPSEIAQNLSGRYKEQYQYTHEDFVKSITYWQRHVFARRW